MPPKIPPKTIVPKEQAKVLYAYTAENDDELTIKEGDIINIIAKEIEDKGWMQGELNGRIGVFPDNFVKIIKPVTTSSLNNNFKNSNNNSTGSLNNGSTTHTEDNTPPKLPLKKPTTTTTATTTTTENNKLSKVISSKFNEIISKSNNNLDESSNSNNSMTPTILPIIAQKSALFTKNQQNSDDTQSINKANNTPSSIITNSTSGTQAPSLPFKKAKLFSSPKPAATFHKESTDSVNEVSLEKREQVNDQLNSLIDEQQHNSSIKLTHLTASRVKGPNNRRPPSIIQLPKDDESTITISHSLNNISDLVNSEKKENHTLNANDSVMLDDTSSLSNNSNNLNQSNKELSKQSSKNNSSISEMMSKVTVTPTTSLANQQQPPWMIELKKTQAEKKNVDVKSKKNFSIGDENTGNSLNSSFNASPITNVFNNHTTNESATSPISSKKSLNNTPTLCTKSTPNHRMSGDFSQKFSSFLQNHNTNSLSRHSSVNNSSHNFNSSRTLSTDSLDCKGDQQQQQQQPSSMLGFGQLTTPSPFVASGVKPLKAAKPSAVKLMSSSPTTPTTSCANNSLLSANSHNHMSNGNHSVTTSVQSKLDTSVTRKEFEDLQKKVTDLCEIVETQKQTYKGLIKDLINDLADEKKKVASLTIEVDRLRKLTTTV